jgi:hypothetical protein
MTTYSGPSSSASIQWQQIDQQSLDTLLTTREGFEMAEKLKGSDASSIVDLLDKVFTFTWLCS